MCSEAGDAAAPCVSTSAKSASAFGRGNDVPDSSEAMAGWLKVRATYTPATAAASATATTEIQ